MAGSLGLILLVRGIKLLNLYQYRNALNLWLSGANSDLTIPAVFPLIAIYIGIIFLIYSTITLILINKNKSEKLLNVI